VPRRRIDELGILGRLVVDILSRTSEPVILQRDGDLCRVTLVARGSWDGPRTFRGRGELQDAVLAALSDASQAVCARRPPKARP
jgi:hypothetical protein